MRFVLYSALFLAFATPAAAAPGDKVVLNEATASSPIHHIGKQIRTSSAQLQTLEELQLSEAAKSLGQISAIALGNDGTLYAAEENRGRIWRLTDRNQDGIFEHRRPLPHKFTAPSAIAVIGENLYVADQAALWVIKPARPKKILAGLTQSQSADRKYFLTSQGGRLTLGLNAIGGQARLIDVDIKTGAARLIRSHDGPLTAMAARGANSIWLGLGSKLSAINGASAAETGIGTQLTGLQLPPYSSGITDWPSSLDNHIIAAQAGPGAMRLLAIPTEFGQPSDEAFVLVDGFLARSGRNAWGQPGPMVMDKRGLFFLDSWNGTIWHLSGKPAPKQIVTNVEPAEKQAEPVLASTDVPEAKPLLKGSGIGAASTIESASSITVGSVLKKDYEDKKQKEREEKEALEEKQRKKH